MSGYNCTGMLYSYDIDSCTALLFQILSYTNSSTLCTYKLGLGPLNYKLAKVIFYQLQNKVSMESITNMRGQCIASFTYSNDCYVCIIIRSINV